MSSVTSDYYPAFLQALLEQRSDHPDIAALLRQPAFAVYRNTVFKGCVDALAANYPAVRRLVGDDWMQAATLAYARQHLPRQASLIAYGEGFAAFLASLPAAAELPYLHGVAQLDRYWTEAHLAADQPPLDTSALHAALAAGQDVRLVPHAAARWHHDAQHPVYTIWSANRAPDVAALDDIDWHGEAALLTRTEAHVQWRPLGPGACAFLDACRAGHSIAGAAALALAREPELDIATLLAGLLQAGAFTTFH
ncbi:MAG TPA: DNA-binding domain-containing protein [Herbaspirillum sp.]|uniref:DNA-binding domain-containing protein n=1 Tax=Herbaspirillum sp. TaxID=1890675 RepID=UPI002D74BA15|nr:DNA-binding domain-containing protein [Herbaspirillum sp.]HZG19649.1 DNA-binding domain-containing protein [Herbaspirillum sp.]